MGGYYSVLFRVCSGCTVGLCDVSVRRPVLCTPSRQYVPSVLPYLECGYGMDGIVVKDH